MTDAENIQEIIRTYKNGFCLDMELTGKPDKWIEGFLEAFRAVDELIHDYLYEV